MTAQLKKYFHFRLQISQQEYLQYYQGTASAVQVVTECGQKVKFPAIRLRSFLTHNGIHGRFCLTIDSNHRFIDLQML
ncbi:MAG: DUF2835 domain-containing protein [Thermodesulfobacteriota bacterium]|nr:DUF2835 domain-containing protein [Thermodesulfobacteriota bacterium]